MNKSIRLEFTELMSRYEALYETVDDDSLPYKSKYEGRSLIIDFVKKIELIVSDSASKKLDDSDSTSWRPNSIEISILRDIQAICHSTLGVNYVQTEENQTGEAHLLYSAGWLLQRFDVRRHIISYPSVAINEARSLSSISRPFVLSDGCPSKDEKECDDNAYPSPTGKVSFVDIVILARATMECCNILALLYSGWSEHPRALRFLRMSKKVYRFVRAHHVAHCSLDSSVICESNLMTDTSSWGVEAVDSQYTHTLFYLAQIYGHLQLPEIAARYVERTLSRQISEQNAAVMEALTSSQIPTEGPDWRHGTSAASLDRVEWTRNVLRLSDFHLARGNYLAVALCIWSGEAMLGSLVRETLHSSHIAAFLKDNPGSSESDAPLMEPPASPLKINFASLPDRLQRQLAECAAHWGLLYERLLGSDSPHLLKRKESGEDPSPDYISSEDPFSTGYVVNFALSGSRGPREGGESSSIRQDGDRTIDTADSDHEAEVDLIPSCSPAKYRENLEASRHRLGPLAAFIEAARPGVRDYIVSYGPSRFDSLLSPARVFASGIHTLDDMFVDCPSPQSEEPAGGEGSPSGKDRELCKEKKQKLFRAACASLTRAREYFVLDGFVTEHIGLLQSQSRVYKALAAYEPVRKAAALHKRREDLLSPLLEELNPEVFLRYHSDISHELAGAARHVLDLVNDEEEKLEGSGRPSALPSWLLALKADSHENCLKYYSHFLRCFKDPRVPDAPLSVSGIRNIEKLSADSVVKSEYVTKPLRGASYIEPEIAEAYLCSHINVGRSLFARSSSSLESYIDNCVAALSRFQWVIDNSDKILLTDEFKTAFNPHMDLCKQIVSVLPTEIEKARRSMGKK